MTTITTVHITVSSDYSALGSEATEAAAAKAIESATFEAEGCERVTTRSYPRALAEAMAVILRARGMEASVAPDCDDRSQAWLYAYDGADSEVEVYEP